MLFGRWAALLLLWGGLAAAPLTINLNAGAQTQTSPGQVLSELIKEAQQPQQAQQPGGNGNGNGSSAGAAPALSAGVGQLMDVNLTAFEAGYWFFCA